MLRVSDCIRDGIRFAVPKPTEWQQFVSFCCCCVERKSGRIAVMKTPIPQSLIVVLIVCLGSLQNAQAVVPPPDGAYPNFTTAEGQNALLHLTTGIGNTAVGALSLSSDTTGNYNVAVGAGALDLNNADSNTAVGTVALLLNTTGTRNTAIGTDALVFNANGSDNTAVGAFALEHNTASGNTAVGRSALVANTSGGLNTVIGASAAVSNTTGHDNTGIGLNVLFSNVDGSFNTAIGRAAMGGNTSGTNNTAVGWSALAANSVGNGNTAVGSQALINSTGSDNTATGTGALSANTSGIGNTGVGNNVLESNTTGSGNVALGDFAGFSATTGDNNVYIGAVGGVAGESDACYIASIFGGTSANGIPVLINAANKLGTTTSSKRFKDQIKPMDKASEAIFALRPVSFHYKKEIDPAGISQFGLVAEEVENVNCDLVVRDKEGKPYSVRYDQVNAMLLNEFLKEHSRVEKLEATVVQQRKDFETAIVELRGQIQKVGTQIELSKAARQTADNR